MIAILKSLFLFIIAGLCEIGGGYLIWLWLRDSKSGYLALVGAIILICYGIIPTFQAAHFGRVYAAYGGVFIILSLLWGWKIDQIKPDKLASSDFLRLEGPVFIPDVAMGNSEDMRND